MGKVFGPEDMQKGRRRLIREALKDLSPGFREEVVKLLEDWGGEASQNELRRILGDAEAEKLLKRLGLH